MAGNANLVTRFSLVAATAATAFFVSCGSDQVNPVAPDYSPAPALDAVKKAGSGSDGGSGSSPRSDAKGDDDDSSATPVKKKPGTPLGTDAGTASASGSKEPAPTAGLDLTEECGGIDEAHASDEIVNENMSGRAAVTKGKKKILGPFSQDYTITSTPTLVIRATSDVDVSSLTIATTATPTSAGADAATAAKKGSGAVTTEMVPLAGRAAVLAAAKGWTGISCTVQPARKVTVQTGAGNVVVQFTPPLPHSLSPRALEARFTAEVGAARQWTGIVATVVSSDVAAAPAGSSFTGTAALRKIAPSAGVTLPDGTVTNVSGELAYELIVDFGGPDVTNALGLKPSTRFFLDTLQHRFSAIVTDTMTSPVDGVPAQTAFVAP